LLVIVVAGLFEVVWAGALKRAADADGMARVAPLLVAATAMAVSVGLLGLALRWLPVGTAYAVWVGVGAVGTAAVGIARFGESAHPLRLACLGGLVASLVGLHLTGCGGAASSTAPSSGAHAAHAMGVHGMVLFGGGDRIFASHLPLFRAPHDYQVVVELEPTDAAARDAILGDLRSAPLVTLEPEPFDLARLARFAPSGSSSSPPVELAGSVYRGHFERDGVLAHERVHFRVRQVLVFRHLDAEAAAAPAQWLAFGSPSETYLVHAIGRRPDVDAIVAVAGAPPTDGVSIVAGEGDPQLPTPAWLATHGWREARLIYRETEDLK
jgi:multidrug transporter EmrE-like cation transporter